MKYQAVFGILFAVLLAGVRSDVSWDADQESCVNELKLDKSTIQNIDKQDIAPEDNTDFNNFAACYWKKLGIQKQDGEIDWVKMDDLLGAQFEKEFKKPDIGAIVVADIVDDAVTQCKEAHIHGSTHGQTVVKVHNCFMHKMQEAAEKFNEG